MVGAALIAPAHPHTPVSHCREAASFRHFSSTTWAPSKWRRRSPSPSVLAAKRKRLDRAEGCGYRGKLRATWERDKRAFYRHRQAERRRVRDTPYECAGGASAIPCYITACESGDSYTAENPSGAYGRYQLMPEWWEYLGRKPTPAEQDHIAAGLWAGGAGASNWVCA